MSYLIHPEFWARWLGIVIIDLSLAGDNALVIAMAVLTLAPRERFVGLIGGTIGAVVIRLALIAIITRIFAIPFVQFAGGLILIWIAVKLVRQDQEIAENKQQRQVGTLWEAMGIIVVADVIMSLDNVMAVAATAHGDLGLVFFGIGLSIPIVICGSSFLARLMERFPWIIWLGGGVLGWVAGEMMSGDSTVHNWLGGSVLLFDWGLPILLSIVITSLAWRFSHQSDRLADKSVSLTRENSS